MHEEVATRMAQRLQWFREKPGSWLHWEPLSGGLRAHQTLRGLLPQARCHVAAKLLPAALQATREEAHRSWNPLHWARDRPPAAVQEDTRVDMLWSNMLLHLESRPLALLRRWNNHIQTNGFLMFSCLGPDTLRELHHVYAQAGWPAPTHAFTDMHDWGDMLVQTGFAEPVMDMERITLSYSGALPLLADLRELGRNCHAGRFSGLRSRAWHQRLVDAIESGLPRSGEGRLLFTVEIIYGHAYKVPPRASRDPSSPAAVSLDEMRAMLRSGRR